MPDADTLDTLNFALTKLNEITLTPSPQLTLPRLKPVSQSITSYSFSLLKSFLIDRLLIILERDIREKD
jgi:hypothetical protein